MRPIPTKNIYYLFLYAWNRLPEGRIVDVSSVKSPDLPNLLAKVLIEGVRDLQRRGLDRAYLEIDEDLVRPRGRMRIGETIARGLRARTRLACTTDELSHDVLHNRIIKSTLTKLARTEGIVPAQHEALAAIINDLSDISLIEITSRDFGRIQLHGNNAVYGFLLRICAFIHEALMPEPGGRRFRFRNVLSDPQTMGRIFQDFVRNFFRLEQTTFTVKGENYPWPIEAQYGHGHTLMPEMRTDTSLLHESRAIIIECKWTGETLRLGKLSSDHLYQLSAYLRYHQRTLGSPKSVEGLLLYPLVDRPLDVEFRLNEQTVRARTIDLTTDWPIIRRQLLNLLEEQPLSRN